MNRTLGIALISATLILLAAECWADESARSPAADFPLQAGDGTQSQMSQFLRKLVMRYIPHSFEDLRNWGKTDERWDGLHIQLDGLKLKTKRRKKKVNHGTWKMYRVKLVDPDRELTVRLENGEVGRDGSVVFDVVLTARLKAFGRTSKWVKGVQLYSFSADADAKAELRLTCHVAVAADITKLPPDLILKPKVVGADLRLVEFRLRRLSNLRGDVAEELGRGVRRVMERKFDQKQDKLIAKMNAQIAKHKDKLRLSLHDEVIQEWNDWTAKVSGSSDAGASASQ